MKEYLLPVGLILLGVAIFLLWRVLRRANPWSRTPYEQQDAFLSPAELAFYQVLDQLVGEDIAICPKPAVREILRVRPQVRRDRQKYFNWISQPGDHAGAVCGGAGRQQPPAQRPAAKGCFYGQGVS